jgi:hypothetical protein
MPQPSSEKSAVSSFRWIAGYLMRHKKVFLPSVFALFATAVLSLAIPPTPCAMAWTAPRSWRKSTTR